MMKKLLLLICAGMLLAASCTTTEFYYTGTDPFSEQLDFYYRRQQVSKTYLLLSSVIFASGFIAGSYFTTARSVDFGNSIVNDAGLYSSYGIATSAAGGGIVSFIYWSKYSDQYLETLKLQTQYYNVLGQ
jgi:hypothetical protein